MGMLNKSPIVKCSHCKKILSFADFESHKCEKSLVDVKTIPVVNFLDTSCNGRKIMTGWGVDDVLYTFEVVPRKPIPIFLDSIRRNLTRDNDRRELDRTP